MTLPTARPRFGRVQQLIVFAFLGLGTGALIAGDAHRIVRAAPISELNVSAITELHAILTAGRRLFILSSRARA